VIMAMFTRYRLKVYNCNQSYFSILASLFQLSFLFT